MYVAVVAIIAGQALLFGNARLLAYKVCDASGNCDDFAIQQAIAQSIAAGAKVINMSLGGPEYSQSLNDMIQAAWNAGIVIVAGAGNDGNTNLFYPAAFDHVISVGAFDEDGKRAEFSNYGSWVDISAPGNVIMSTYPMSTCDAASMPGQIGCYTWLSGTSMATPHVSGAAALIWSRGDVTSNQQVVDILLNSADPVGVDPVRLDSWTIHGGLNVHNALSYGVSNLRPVANAGADQTLTDTNGDGVESVTLDGSASSDPDGSIVSWSWSFGDGATATGPVVSHTYTMTGYFYSTLTVTDNLGETNTAYATIQVVSGGSLSPASNDAGTTLGQIVSGSYLDTQTQNNIAEVLTESLTGGTPSTRKSQLEHTWSLTVAPGGMQTFFVDAWHTANTEGDDFVFEYSLNNLTWIPMVTVTKTADNSVHQTYVFGENVTGPIQVRVRDLDRTEGRSRLDKLSIDEMFVTSRASTGYCGEAALAGGAPLEVSMTADGQISLTWGPSCVVTDTDYVVYEGRLGDFGSHVPLQCSTGGAGSLTFTLSAESSYYIVVPTDGYYEGRYGSSSSGADIPAGPTRCYPAAVANGCR